MSSEVFFQKSEKMISKLVLTAFFTIGMLAVNARNNKNIEISIIPSWGTEQLSLNLFLKIISIFEALLINTIAQKKVVMNLITVYQKN